MHVCPMVTPGVPPIPHVGGPIIPPCSINVITGFMPQARITDKCVCVGPMDVILKGSPTVLVNNLMAARIGDPTVHGGTIVSGFPSVLIGEAGSGVSISFKADLKLSRSSDYPSKGAAGYMKSDDAAAQGFKNEAKWQVGVEFKKETERKKYIMKSESENAELTVRAGVFDRSALLGVKGDLNGEFDAGLFTECKVAAITIEAKGKTLEGLVEAKAEGEVLSATATVDLGFKKSEEFTGFVAEAGAEAVVAKGSVGGSIRISPKTIYDNTCGRLVRWFTGDDKRGRLGEKWDHGVSLGGKVEAGFGAAAKAGARLGKVSTFGASIGLGPMVGFSLSIGIY